MSAREKATPGNKLYIYRLLRTAIGVGKQEFLPNVEKILTDDDIYPEDMGFESVLEMLRSFDEFVNLTEFKGGRVYVRLIARDDWDKWLDTAESEKASEHKPKGSKGRAKPWKHAKKGPKVVHPVKPKHKVRLMPEPEEEPQVEQVVGSSEEEASLQAEKDASITESTTQSGRTAQEEAAQQPSESTTTATVAKPAEEPIAEPVIAAPTSSQGSAQAKSVEQPPAVDSQKPQEAGNGATEARSAQEGSTQPQSTTAEANLTPATGGEQPLPTNAQKDRPRVAPSFPRIRLTIVSDGTGSESSVNSTQPTETNENRQRRSQKDESTNASASIASASAAPTSAPERPVQAPTDSTVSSADIASVTVPTRTAQDTLNATSEAKERSLAEFTPAEAPLSPVPAHGNRNSNLPTSFWNEVHCKDELLSILMRTLPFDVDLTRVLEEDWQVARATGMATGTRSKVVFPIRYLRPDGTHIELTIRRISRPLGGKHWALMLVDGDDGTGTLHEAAGLEGAPQGDEGAWQDLSATLLPADLRVSPLRELAQFCSIGSWDATLGALTGMVAPERWDYPGEGVGRSSRLGILREYICITLHRLQEENKVAVSPTKDFCVANTGLMTTMTEDIYACFVPANGGSAPWEFAGFALAGSGDLGRRITATFDPLPQPASYVESLDQVMPRMNKLVALDYRTIIGRQLDKLPRGFLQEQFEHHTEAAPLLQKALDNDATLTERNQALRELGRVATSDPGLYRRLCLALDDAVAMAKHRVRASFRLCAPAYDPQTGLVDLLLPLALIADGQADCALVLEPQPSGNYQASSILTLPRAYACARVISKYQPAWLLPEKVLAS